MKIFFVLLDNDYVAYEHLLSECCVVVTVTPVRINITICNDRWVTCYVYTYFKKGQQAHNV